MIDHADDEGYLGGDPRSLKAKVFPADDIPAGDVETFRDEIIKANMAIIHKAEGGPVLEIPRFTEYNAIRADRSTKSQLKKRIKR